MRLAIDMQGTLTDGSRPRGIGRYVSNLVQAMADLRGDTELRLALNGAFPDAVRSVTESFEGNLPAGALSTYRVPRSEGYRTGAGSPRRQIADAIVRRHFAGLAPDAILFSSLFEQAPEDFSPLHLPAYPAHVTATILYDLIPLVFSDQYLADPADRATYNEIVRVLCGADVLLAISESSKRDAVSRLSVDPGRIAVIGAAADMQFKPLNLAPDMRRHLGRKLGLSKPFVFYFGGADMRKNFAGAIEIYAALEPEVRAERQLLLVSNFRPDDLARLRDLAARSGLSDQDVVLRSDLGNEDLVQVLNACDALLFASLYEGFGLPLLEAMQCGTRVVAARTSSIPEIVDREDLLFEPDDVQGGARALTRVLCEPEVGADVSAWGQRRAGAFSWRRTARLALDVLEERTRERQRSRVYPVRPCELLDIDGVRADFAQVLADAPSCDEDIDRFVDDLMASVPLLRPGGSRRLLIDVTDCARNGAWTGIQRVVRKLTSALYDQRSIPGVIPIAVRLTETEIFSVPDFTAAGFERSTTDTAHPIEIQPGDELFMLDSNWTDYPAYRGHFRKIRQGGGRVIGCVYDLIPELHPDVCASGLPAIHERWLTHAVRQSDALLCISRAVADDLVAYITSRHLPHRPQLKIGWFHCGSDIVRSGQGGSPRDDVRRVFAPGRPTFLSVGTIEPRKSHGLALDAFDALWAEGRDVALCLIGARGWKADRVESRIIGHAEFGRRLHWFWDAKDVDVAYAYNHSVATLCMSMAEGFGLPIAEAARYNRPVICSGIPVFLEVGGNGAIYFEPGKAASLAEKVGQFLDGRVVPDPSEVVRESWAEAAQRVLDILYRDMWYDQFGGEDLKAS